MEKLYKRFIIIILIPVIVAAFPFLMYANADSEKAYDWYFKPTNDNSQPEVIPEADFLDDYNTVYLGNKDEKTLYLTFDAGYDNGYHTDILDTLKQKNVKAAFFVDGNFVKTNPDLVKRMANEGHLVCNHSKNHPDMTKYSDFSEYSEQINGWNDLVKQLGITPNGFFRFPMGKFSKRALEYNEQLGVTSVFWSFAYYDWVDDDQPSQDTAKDKIFSRVHNGAVLLLHSTSKTNAQILADVIDKLTADGYTFKSLTEFKK